MKTVGDNAISKYQSLKYLFISVLSGLAIGALTLFFIKSLEKIENFHEQLNLEVPYQVFLIPVVLITIIFLKRNTLFFPTKVSQLPEEKNSTIWSVWTTPANLFGTLFSHISGVSVGREGAVVLFSAGLSRVFKLDWIFWGPVLSSAGFSAIVGNYFVAPFFMYELFGRTNLLQKLYSVVSAVTAVLFIKTYHQEALFKILNFNTEMGFFKKLFFFFFFAAVAGMLMKIYKKVYYVLSHYFAVKSMLYKVIIAMLLMACLYLPEFRGYQSLGLLQISQMSEGSMGHAILKLYFTLVSTTIGFLGGEFIPLIYSGIHFGAGFFRFFGEDMGLGAALGFYLLFASASRFKWTSYILVWSLMGFSWWFWSYFVVSIAISFSGQTSIYKNKIQQY